MFLGSLYVERDCFQHDDKWHKLELSAVIDGDKNILDLGFYVT